MDNKVMNNLSYGLFVLTARENEKDNGCIINTAVQLTTTPNRVSIAVNKSNYTHDMIVRTKACNISIISEAAEFDMFKHFGFQSGKDVNKFDEAASDWMKENISNCKRSGNGIYYIEKGTNGYISLWVTDMVDLGTHTLFICEVCHGERLGDVPSATYSYYHANIKAKPMKEKSKDGKTVYRCKICGYEYEGEELPEDFVCPICKHPASDFEKV